LMTRRLIVPVRRTRCVTEVRSGGNMMREIGVPILRCCHCGERCGAKDAGLKNFLRHDRHLLRDSGRRAVYHNGCGFAPGPIIRQPSRTGFRQISRASKSRRNRELRLQEPQLIGCQSRRRRAAERPTRRLMLSSEKGQFVTRAPDPRRSATFSTASTRSGPSLGQRILTFCRLTSR